MSIFEQINIQIVEIKHRSAERGRKREADELVSDLESSPDKEEELKDLLEHINPSIPSLTLQVS